jgi:hypothetical protein
LEIVFFFFYVIFFVAIIYCFKLNAKTGFSQPIIIAIFLIKVAIGCINLYVHQHEYITNDIYFYHSISLKYLSLLPHNPKAFFYEWLFNWGSLSNHLNFFKKENMQFWNTLGSTFHEKFMTLCNILSLGHLYVNVIFFNFCFFVGQLYLYKTFYQLQSHKKWLFLCTIFLIPSVAFWCSGIHKDGWLLAGFGMLIYSTYQYKQQKLMKYFMVALMSLFFIFILRYFYFLCLLLPYLLWLMLDSQPRKIMWYSVIYIIAGVLFFSLKQVSASLDPMQLVVNRQAEFIQIRGYSDMRMPCLSNNFESFASIFPTAIDHIFLKPRFAFHSLIKYQYSAIDSYLVFAIIMICACCMKRKNMQYGMLICILFFSLSVYLFIGFTVPNAGALVRYKSVFTALLIPTLVALSELPKFRKMVF